MRSILTIIAVLFATLACTRSARAQTTTTIDLRTTVTLPAGSPVLLKHIATIAGPDADRLGTVVILHADEAKGITTTDSIAPHPLSRDTLRASLDNAAANWARTILRGGTITITFTPSNTPLPQPAPVPAQPSITTPVPPPAATLAPAPAPVPAPIDPRSLRALIINALVEAAGGVEGGDITAASITLRTGNLPEPDQELLAAPVPAAWTCNIRILGSSPSGRTPVKIDAYEGDRVALSKTITVEAFVKRDLLIVSPVGGGIAKDRTITTTDLRTEPRTLGISESARIPSLIPEQLIGTVAKRRIDAGKPIVPTDVAAAKTAVVVKRGDDVQVSCLAGGILLKSRAKSLGTARDGELVQLQVEGSKKVISARMNGPGKAIVSLDPAPPAPPAN